MLLLSKNGKHIFIWSYSQYYSTVTKFSLSFPSVYVFLNDGNWKKRSWEIGEGCNEEEQGKARKGRKKEREGKGGTNRGKTTRRRKPSLPENAGILWPRTQPSVLQLPSHLFFSSIFIALQIPCFCSFLLSRIIECFWILHSSAASCLFLILFHAKEGKMSQTIFCSFSFPIDIWDLLTHCLI